MHLLSPDDLKADKTNELEKKRALLAGLAEEEARVNRDLNQAKENDTAERARIKTQFEVFESEIIQRRAELLREVSTLETRRADALKPIENIQGEAEALLEKNKKDEALIRERERALSEKENEVIERLERVSDSEQEIVERQEALKHDETIMASERLRLRDSHRALSDRWTEYHAQVHKTNIAITQAQRDVEVGRIANESRNNTLDEFDKELRSIEVRVKEAHNIVQNHMKKLGITSI